MCIDNMRNNYCGCSNNNYNMPNNNCNCGNSNNCDYDDEYIEDMCSYVSNYNSMPNDCNCGFNDGNNYFPDNPMFGQSYVPIQTMNNTFKPCIGLKMGTIFPELVSPYMPGQSMKEIEYIKCKNEIKEGCNKC